MDLPIIFAADEPLVEFPVESITVSVPLTEVGDGLYRLEGVPLGVGSAGFGDIIEVEPGEEGRLRFVCVAERGGWRTYDFALPLAMMGSERLEALERKLEAQGVYWERLFGGLLFICVPHDVDLDPTSWVESAVRG